MTLSTELEQLFPTGKEISISNTPYVIKPFKFGELPKVLKAIGPITTTLAALIGNRDNMYAAMAQLIADGGDSVIDLMMIGSKQPREWIENLEMDEGIDVLTAIIEVNADFFIKRVLPLINKATAQVAGRNS